jgi:ubiquinol-cytochrome c reductase cytochrome c1 subunit
MKRTIAMTIPKSLLAALAALVLVASALPAVAEGPEMTQQRPPIDRRDIASLQRGARLFLNYCVGCHGAQHMRFNRLKTDLGLTDEQVADNLIFRGTLAKDGYVTDKIGDTMKTSMERADAKEAFGVVPPDLSVEARVRGTEWLYSYLRGYYRDDKTATGWNNLVFPNVAMPNVLWEMGGQNKLLVHEFNNESQARAEFVQVHNVAMLETEHLRDAQGNETGETRYVLRIVERDQPGTMSQQDFDSAVADIVNYLDYMAEPAKGERMQVGIKVLIFLALLFVFAYWTKREYWKDVH